MRHQTNCKGLKKSWCHVEPKCEAHPTGCQFGDPKARSVQKLINAYDSELAYVDLYLKEVFEELEALGLSDDTLVIITSDHGESFKDRKPSYLFHGRSVYNEELHVPLIIKAPRAQPQRRSEVVGLVDVVPTLTALAGIESTGTNGVTLGPLLAAPAGDSAEGFQARTLFLEQLPYPGHEVHMIAALNPTGLKLTRDLTHNTWALFDLNSDWGERTDLLKSAPEGAEALKAAIGQHIDLTP